jgi:drug/metabolite transporter (DMT)-like permease
LIRTRKEALKSDLLLLLTSLIWGFAFVAQRSGMTFMGPFTFNAVRFLLGGLFVLAISSFWKDRDAFHGDFKKSLVWKGGILTGLMLFLGASLQQVGLVGATAGKAGFITGLYVVLVPLLGMMIGRKTSVFNWIGALCALFGLYLLSITIGSPISFYDFLVFLGAFAWAIHVHLIGYFAPKIGAIRLAIIQFLICGILSLGLALGFEEIVLSNIAAGWLPMVYGSIFSVGLAYTLQVVAQKKADPSHAAIILSMEALFAAIGGWIILNEVMSLKEILGAIVMIVGMLLSQLDTIRKLKIHTTEK